MITEVEESDERSTSSAKSAERYDDMVIPALNKKKQMIPEYAEFEDVQKIFFLFDNLS